MYTRVVAGLTLTVALAVLPRQPAPDSLAIASIRDADGRIERGLPTHRQHDLSSHDAVERTAELQRTARLLTTCAGAAASDSSACTAPD